VPDERAAQAPPPSADLALNAACAWIGPLRVHRLLERFGSAAAVLRADAGSISAAVPALSGPQARALLDFCAAFDGEAERAALARPGLRSLAWDSEGYPRRLRELPSPPPMLFVEGALPPEGAPAVAVVGTRRPTEYGRRMARRLASELALAGVWVVSGLARGIDTEAHAACLEAGGATVAVLGSGLDKVWPGENKPLARRIVEQKGGLVSQFSMAAPPLKLHFPMRNWVISALSRGVVVVEGARDSGSMITANLALEQGREVFAVPGPADAPQSQGPLDLIRDGAKLVRGVEDILRELGLETKRPRARGRQAPPPGFEAGSPARRLWDCLPDGVGRSLDEAGRDSGLDAGALAAAVTELELAGAVRRLPGAQLERVNQGF
jgi:DNA processing protein